MTAHRGLILGGGTEENGFGTEAAQELWGLSRGLLVWADPLFLLMDLSFRICRMETIISR